MTHLYAQGICTKHPQYVALPGISIPDIPIQVETNESPLVAFLQKQGRKLDKVLGDGNCLFRALSLQLTGVQDHHIALRKLIARCESEYKEFEGVHITINQTRFADHIKNVRKSCTWGTNLEIIVTATLFGVDVYLASDTYRAQTPLWLKYSPYSTVAAATEMNSALLGEISKFPLLPQVRWLELAHNRHHFDAVKCTCASSVHTRPALLENN